MQCRVVVKLLRRRIRVVISSSCTISSTFLFLECNPRCGKVMSSSLLRDVSVFFFQNIILEKRNVSENPVFSQNTMLPLPL